MNQNNAVNWFEIPVSDFERAKKFYSSIFDYEMFEINMQNLLMGFLPYQGEGVSGAIVKGEGYEPSENGVIVYLNGGDDLQAVLDRIENAGGKILTPKMRVTDDIGHIALFLDSEGNRLGLHSRN